MSIFGRKQHRETVANLIKDAKEPLGVNIYQFKMNVYWCSGEFTGGCLEPIGCGLNGELPSVTHSYEEALEQGCSTENKVTEMRPDGNPTVGAFSVSDMYGNPDKWDAMQEAALCGDQGALVVQLDNGDHIANYVINGGFTEVPAMNIANNANATMGFTWQPSTRHVRAADGEIPSKEFCDNVTATATPPEQKKVSRATQKEG